MAIPDYTELPATYARETIKLYLENGKPMGHFLSSVFANDLFGAVGRADDINIRLIPEYVKWIYNYAPMGCHGSYDKVKAWIENKHKENNDA